MTPAPLLSDATPRRVFILGSTGSIGTSALDVMRDFARRGETRFELVGLGAGQNASSLEQQAREFAPRAIALVNSDAPLQTSANCEVFRGEHAVCEMLTKHARRGDLVLAAMVGASATIRRSPSSLLSRMRIGLRSSRCRLSCDREDLWAVK